jgi:ribonuclease P protein subunit RPR2
MDVEAIARQRIQTLLELARQKWPSDKALSRRYVSLAKKIAMRHRVKLGNRLFCKKCGVVFVPGRTVRVRKSAKQKAVLYICQECGAARKFGC